MLILGVFTCFLVLNFLGKRRTGANIYTFGMSPKVGCYESQSIEVYIRFEVRYKTQATTVQ